ncbi:SAGA complex subunit Sgf29 [Apiospora phragmitis]|uniref:SAGA complex subunit Sgf29 n=1 Tax=Apiospora phragmitis TaxID=2905665 RepID=A0ABR1VSR1_9PEZI
MSELSKHWEEPLGPRRHAPFSASRSPSASTAHSPRKASIPTLPHSHSRSHSQSQSQPQTRDDTPSATHPPSRPKSKSRSQSRNDISLPNPATGSRPPEPPSVPKPEEPPSQAQSKEAAATTATTESDTPPRKAHSGPRSKSKTHRATKSGNLSQSENEMSQRNRPRGPSRTNEAVGRGEEFQLWQNTRERMAGVLKSINDTSRLTRDVAVNDKSAAAKDKAGESPAQFLKEMDRLLRSGVKVTDATAAEIKQLIEQLKILKAVKEANEMETTNQLTSTSRSATQRAKESATASSSVYDFDGAGDSPVPSPNPSASRRSAGGAGSSKGDRDSVPPKLDRSTPAAKAGSVEPQAPPRRQPARHGPRCLIDADPDEAGNRSEFRTSASNMIAISKEKDPLPSLDTGKVVLALYPNTTTFYKAEVMGMTEDGNVNLKFEGEESSNTMQSVTRHYVLEYRG